ncbi:MAG: DUF4954 family protein [Bacteroidota bacterium]
MAFRELAHEEIVALENNGCFCDNWDSVMVAESFETDRIRNSTFSGHIKIGSMTDTKELPGNRKIKSGIYNSSLHNTEVGNNTYISNVKNIANYIVEENVQIENVDSIIVDGTTTFGNGTELEILNEGGGRELKIFDQLTSQIAYLIVLYRHDKQFIEKLESMIGKYVDNKKSDVGYVKKGSSIYNCGQIKNVYVGDYAAISGSLKLEEGSVISCSEAPTFVGFGVSANDFIIHSGSKVDGGAIIDKCFIGQGVKISKQFSAENSAFFANCEGFHGEAVSLFAGPYTVSHHKSTLLIAGLYSFYNAGSGTNQSNHMYKLGPLHQGIMERGSKTGSFNYLLWPCRVGAFSACIGKHYANFDASDFPFSYISEEDGLTVLTPAMNLLTVGTKRDSEKWGKRDRRKDPNLLDLINFELFSPYTVGKMVKAQSILKELKENASRDQEYVSYNGLKIKRLMIRTTSKYYEIGISIFIGKVLFSMLNELSSDNIIDDLKAKFIDTDDIYSGEWTDIAGMITSVNKANELINSINTDQVSTVDELRSALNEIHNSYSIGERVWWQKLVENRFGIKINEINAEIITQIINDWVKNSTKLNNMIAKDAQKEFDSFAMIGFGIDGNEDVKRSDFLSVRGDYDTNSFVKSLNSEIEEFQIKAENILKMI